MVDLEAEEECPVPESQKLLHYCLECYVQLGFLLFVQESATRLFSGFANTFIFSAFEDVFLLLFASVMLFNETSS